MSPRGRLELRVSDEERGRWQDAADDAGVTLSEWMRERLDQAAAEEGGMELTATQRRRLAAELGRYVQDDLEI